MKKFTAFLAAAASVLSLSAEVLWQADMTKEKGGFTVFRQTTKADSIKVENGALVFRFHKGVNKGIESRQLIPMPERGELSFDATMNVGNKAGYGAWSVKIHLYGKLIAWNGSPNWGLAVFTPPAKWETVSRIDNNREFNYRIRFDRTKETMDIFLNGSLIPIKSFKGVKFNAPQDGKGFLEIGNYGYASGKLTHKIRNLKLETIAAGEDYSESKVIWSEKFTQNGSLQENGYKQVANNKKDQFSVQDGVLTMVCQNSPYKGTAFEKKIPGVLRGELSFEAAVGVGNGYSNYSMNLYFNNLNLAWRPKGAWHLHHPQENKWYSLTNLVPAGEWQKYMIRFDVVKKTAEYFVNDMENPVFIDEKSEFVPTKETILTIRNYGLSNGAVVNKIRNIELRVIPEKKKSDSVSLNGTMFFQGVSSDEWKAKELVKRLGESKVSTYTIQAPAHHVKNDNVKFDLQPKPSPNSGLPKFIVFADMPAKPIPGYTMKMIRKSVENGGRLIILDGLFTLQKGEFAGTVLEEILPVSVKDPWKKTIPLPGASFIKRNGKNVAIYKKIGKGVVYVIPGNAVKEPALADVLASLF